MFGKRLKETRKSKNLTLDELAAIYNQAFAGGLSKGTLSKYENEKQEPMITVVKNLAAILDTSIDYLLGETENPQGLNIFSIPNVIPLPETKLVPLLGNIACGTPILATENIDEYIKMSGSIKADFALKCKGNSMINARIFDGDIVYIHQQPDVENGQIAAVLIDDEATLKRVHKYPDKVILRAENPTIQDIVISGEELATVRTIGLAVAFISMVK